MERHGPLPPNFEDNVNDIAMLTNNLIDRTAVVFADASRRWADGLSRSDVSSIITSAGNSFSDFAILVYQTLEQNVTPSVPGDEGE